MIDRQRRIVRRCLGLLLVGGIVGLVVTAAASAEGVQAWPMEGGDVERSSTVADSGGGVGEVLWSYDTGSPKTSDSSFGLSAPSYADGTLYIGTVDSNVHAIDPRDGTRVWKQGFRSSGIETAPVVQDGALATATYRLHVQDAVTGEDRWNRGGDWQPPVIAGDRLVAMGDPRQGQENVTAFLLVEGQPSWSRNLSVGPGGILPMEERLIVPVNRALFALDRSTGETLWTNRSLTSPPGSPVLANETVVTETSNALVGLDPATGEIAWQKDGAYRGGRSSTLATDGASLYAFEASGLEKRDLDDQSLAWRTSFEDLTRSGLEPSRPAVTDSTLYIAFRYTGVAGGGDARADDAEGEGGARQKGCDPARPYGSPKADEKPALLFALDSDTGEPVGALNGSGFRSPVVVNGTLYVASQDGCLYGVSTEPASGPDEVQISPDRRASSPDDGNAETNGTPNDTEDDTGGPLGDGHDTSTPGGLAVLAIFSFLVGARSRLGE